MAILHKSTTYKPSTEIPNESNLTTDEAIGDTRDVSISVPVNILEEKKNHSITDGEKEEDQKTRQRKEDDAFLKKCEKEALTHQVQPFDETFNTKSKNAIGLLLFVIFELLMFVFYWRKIVDAMINPFIAINNALQQDNSITIELNPMAEKMDNVTHTYFSFLGLEPTPVRMTYHFLGTSLYLWYMMMNVIIFINVMIKFPYIDDTSELDTWPEWVWKNYKCFSCFLYGNYDKMRYNNYKRKYSLISLNKYTSAGVALLTLAYIDDMCCSYLMGNGMSKLPYNWLVFDVLRMFCFYVLKTSPIMGGWAGGFLLFGTIFVGWFFYGFKFILPTTCLHNLFGIGIEDIKERKKRQDRRDKILRERSEEEMKSGKSGLKLSPIKTRKRIPLGKEPASKEHFERFEDKETFVPQIKIVSLPANDELPPRYDDEILVPTYEEAIFLSNGNIKNNVRSDSTTPKYSL